MFNSLIRIACAATALVAGVVQAKQVVDLSGADWTVSNPAFNISVPGSWPSYAHVDLYNAQVIGDPYHGLNDFNLRWVAWSNWTYTSSPIRGLKSNSTTWLVFQGLDTFASIDLCGKKVGNTNNQFRQYYFDVSTIMKSCSADPILKVNFGSSPDIADDIAAKPFQETWPPLVQQVFEFPNRWFIRKEQSDFGWDWGPAFSPTGPWQPAYVVQLEKSTDVYVRNTLIDVYREGQRNNMIPDQSKQWVVNASVDYIGNLPYGAKMSYSIKDAQDKVVNQGMLSNVNQSVGVISGQATVPSSDVELWWPNGMGSPTLYNMTVQVTDSNDEPLTSVQRRIGFRTIVLNEGPITQQQLAQGIAPGDNWHFEINGHEFFVKGSNFIPPDAFWTRVNRERMESLFTSVVDARQNMLRVWASGIYLPDFIYDIADEKGILLWSEFQFGDALYPVDQDFLDNVAEEANYNVRRVNYHPSLAFWAGGNELENLELSYVNMSSGNQKDEVYNKYKGQYEKIFLDTIFPKVFENTRSISYAPSSASNGIVDINFDKAPYLTERYQNTVPGSIYGEIEYYQYAPEIAFDASHYLAGRFTAEFGYHSMPSLQSWQQALSPKDLHFNSSVIVGRNHHFPPGGLNVTDQTMSLIGMGQMTQAVQEWYPTPMKTDSVANFSAWCHATQVFQSDFYKSQMQWYRRGSGLKQRTMGILYWQLDDIWQAPTWAGIEYDGRWKALHYTGKDIYSNVIVSPFYNNTVGDFSIWVTSDLFSSARGSVSAAWYDWNGNQILNQSVVDVPNFEVGAINSTQVYTTTLSKTLAGVDWNNAVMRLSVNATGGRPNSEQQEVFTHTNWFVPASLSKAKLVDPGLQLSYDAAKKTFTVEATKGVASHVWLDYPAGSVVTFDANDFWMAKGEKRTVGFKIKSGQAGDEAWARSVTVQSLWNQTLST